MTAAEFTRPCQGLQGFCHAAISIVCLTLQVIHIGVLRGDSERLVKDRNRVSVMPLFVQGHRLPLPEADIIVIVQAPFNE